MQTGETDLTSIDATAIPSCWKTIGVAGGDRSCDQLPRLIHCRNCDVYAQGGRLLFDRPMPSDYRQTLTALVADAKTKNRQVSNQTDVEQTLSVSLFRLEDEWFGLGVGLFQAVAAMAAIRPIPGRSNAVFLGLVNFNGELQLCVSLKSILGLDKTAPRIKSIPGNKGLILPRMVMVQPESPQQSDRRWVFAVDEFYGIKRIEASQIQAPPASPTIGGPPAQQRLTQGLFEWQGKSVSYLDPAQLFNSIERRLLP